jgi:hypothetical protein
MFGTLTSAPHWLKPHYDKGLVLSGTHTPHEYQSLVYAHFEYTPDPSHCCFDKVPLTRGKSYYNKQERDWWQQANLPEKLDDDYSEMESTFMERKTSTQNSWV